MLLLRGCRGRPKSRATQDYAHERVLEVDGKGRPRRERQMSATDQLVLDIESRWGSALAMQSAKMADAQAHGLSPQEYALVLRGLIDDPLAVAYAPKVIASLRELRDSRR